LVTLIVWPKPPKVMTSRQTALEQPAQGVVGTATDDAGDAEGAPAPTMAGTTSATPAAPQTPQASLLRRILWRIPAPLVVLLLGTL
ncbi:hypothetical protein NL487_27690, partial [Klebsiella pneumoniae]|nr:hypothetical protein [Klebsiella pneumoniae]